MPVAVPAPDAALHNPDVEYVRSVIARTGISQRACAERVGVSYSTLKNWMAGLNEWPYPAQYTLECLAAFAGH